jgi:hypothetical protein
MEVDSVKNTLLISLPMPIVPLPYMQTVATNHPEHKSGSSQQLLHFGGIAHTRWGEKPLAVALQGDVRQQAGEQVIKTSGKGSEGGTLTVRWRFAVQ